MKFTALFSVLATLAVSGCDVPQSPVAKVVVITRQVEPVGSSPVDLNRAVALFDAVCGATLPGFANAPARMAANGITVASSQGTASVYSATEDVSFQIQDGPGQGRTCSMVFGTTNPPPNAASALSGLGQFVETPLGPGAIYRNTTAVVLIGNRSEPGPVTYLNLRLLSER
jgi:hypothetical protein